MAACRPGIIIIIQRIVQRCSNKNAADILIR